MAAPKPEPIEFITIEQVAERLHVSRRKVQDLIKVHPFYRRLGRRKLFSVEDFNALVAKLPCGAPAEIETSTPPPEASLWREARRLLAEDAPAGTSASRPPVARKVIPLRRARRESG